MELFAPEISMRYRATALGSSFLDATFLPVDRTFRRTNDTHNKGAVMELKKFFLEQLDAEATASRKTLERVPEGYADWKPHEKSMELGKLAALVATMPGWANLMIGRDKLDLDDPSSDEFRTKPVERRAELLRLLDESVAQARKIIESTTEEHLQKPWGFAMGGQIIAGGPRYAMISNALFSHLAHHRGQLTVYLRLLDAKVPAIYGPSADEQV